MERIVYLKRAAPFKHEAMHSEVMQEQLALTQKSIGNFFTKSGKKSATGLTADEEDILIPILLGIKLDNQVEYVKAKEEYFTNIVTKIPGGKVGLALNIGLRDNNKPVCAILEETENGKIRNLPDEIENYITYRHAIAYPYTAPSIETMEGDSTIQYYIEDPKKVIESNFKELEIKDNAWTEYVKVKSDKDKVNMLLTVLKTYIRKQSGKAPVNINNLSLEEKIIVLRDIATTRPEKFYQYATDQNLKKRYFIEECLSVSILNRVGSTFFDVKDNNYALGDSIVEVIATLFDPKQTSRLNRLKAQYDEIKNINKVIA